MASWWSTIFGSTEKEPEHIADDKDKEIGGLNFKTALEAHLKWKVRLMGIIDGTSTETIDPNIVSRDDQCILGKWLHGEGEKQYQEQPGFQNLVSSHAHFHRCAGNTLNLALDGKTQEAATEIANGDFAKASLDVSRHLMRLWRDLGIEKNQN
ncbi:MAG: CZB domain-containing protein [Gallionella sp.]|nr:CZB domain-containing protein [Gallionella sp.]